MTTTTATDNNMGRDNGSEDSSLPAPSAMVLACGYRQVHIPKSGLSFPAWLVYIRDNESSCRCVWRSKRHFWRLARQMDRLLLSSSSSSAAAAAAAPQQQPFPKAAWKKLCDAAPWKRPDFEAHVSTMLPKEASSNDPRALLDAENQWQPKMTKGLLQLDQYLQRAAALDEAHDAWHEFVQAPFEGNDDDLNRNQPDDYNIEASRVGNALGQYFCDPRNARQVVQTALHRLELLHNGSPASSQSLLFVEPSCGYGQIIETLLQQFAASSDEVAIKNKNGKNNDSFHVRGIDLDAVAIATCQEKFRLHSNVSLSCCNFLETSVGDKEHKTVIVVGGPPYTAGAGKANDDDKSSLGRDLPMQFVRHAIQAHAAAVICLLMPARCESVDYVADGWIPSFSSSSYRYEYETIPLQAPSLFYFQGGGEPVKQPSVIQCFWRVDV